MMKSKLPCLAIVAIAVFVMFSCGGSTAPSDQESSEPSVAENKKMTPDEMGVAVSELYVSAMSDLNKLLEDDPPASEVAPKIAALKEEYVQKLVEYGKKREGLTVDDKPKMDLAIRLGLNDVYDNQVYTSYSEAVNDYFDDNEVRDLLSSFNILTQYANFDLLREQEPDEARRLGIE
jgi:hypothetical protein